MICTNNSLGRASLWEAVEEEVVQAGEQGKALEHVFCTAN
jgi:hypothetical protein